MFPGCGLTTACVFCQTEPRPSLSCLPSTLPSTLASRLWLWCWSCGRRWRRRRRMVQITQVGFACEFAPQPLI
ncbi:hypothetical protein AB205_0104570 [Aquarana catesbeiana]|uniref:Uncharacterized protein n=1 Tax=Aquarana catesbeiana TaxID=8400 RepID=A0A2G9QK09_AQUCT|nr:hypothetical protein AB205_0104570 [Aquarana catesbeiana]